MLVEMKCLAYDQISEEMDTQDNITLHSDGTSKFGEHLSSYLGAEHSSIPQFLTWFDREILATPAYLSALAIEPYCRLSRATKLKYCYFNAFYPLKITLVQNWSSCTVLHAKLRFLVDLLVPVHLTA